MKITDEIKEFNPSYKFRDYTVEFLEAVEYADDIDTLQDSLHELADMQVDIYNYDLIKWLGKDSDNIWAVEEAIDEFGTPMDSEGRADFYGIIRQGQYKYYSDLFYEMLEEYRELLEAVQAEAEDE